MLTLTFTDTGDCSLERLIEEGQVWPGEKWCSHLDKVCSHIPWRQQWGWWKPGWFTRQLGCEITMLASDEMWDESEQREKSSGGLPGFALTKQPWKMTRRMCKTCKLAQTSEFWKCYCDMSVGRPVKILINQLIFLISPVMNHPGSQQKDRLLFSAWELSMVHPLRESPQ